MLKATTVAASAATAAGIVGPTAPGPFTPYLCQPTLADASGQAWAFDLTSISGTQNLIKSNYPFDFAGCGISNFTCSSDSVWNLAAGVQDEGNGACEILSAPQSVPLFSLLSPGNAAAGVQMTFAAASTSSGDFGKCSVDPRTGGETGRSMIVQYQCDPTVPAGTVKPLSAFENPECSYNIIASTAAACPVKANAPPSGLPAPGPAQPLPAGYGAFFNGPSGPFAPYLCNPVLKDSTGASYSYNLASTYTGAAGWDWNVTSPSGTKYSFQLCGYANTLCVPSGYNTFANYGTAVETLASGTPSNGPCIATNGSYVPCTQDCHVLANNAPAWSLINPADGTAGITATYTPAETTSTDPYACPFDPVNFQPTPRQLTINVKCDQTVPAGTLVFDGVAEPSTCYYVASARSATACGVKQA